jgi:hypothetical protein
MGLTSDSELYELLLIEEADAWFEYADATKGQVGGRYAEIEQWEWARAAAAAANRAHAALPRARRPPKRPDRGTSALGALASLEEGDAIAFRVQLLRAPARGEAARAHF